MELEKFGPEVYALIYGPCVEVLECLSRSR